MTVQLAKLENKNHVVLCISLVMYLLYLFCIVGSSREMFHCLIGERNRKRCVLFITIVLQFLCSLVSLCLFKYLHYIRQQIIDQYHVEANVGNVVGLRLLIHHYNRLRNFELAANVSLEVDRRHPTRPSPQLENEIRRFRISYPDIPSDLSSIQVQWTVTCMFLAFAIFHTPATGPLRSDLLHAAVQLDRSITPYQKLNGRYNSLLNGTQLQVWNREMHAAPRLDVFLNETKQWLSHEHGFLFDLWLMDVWFNLDFQSNLEYDQGWYRYIYFLNKRNWFHRDLKQENDHLYGSRGMGRVFMTENVITSTWEHAFFSTELETREKATRIRRTIDYLESIRDGILSMEKYEEETGLRIDSKHCDVFYAIPPRVTIAEVVRWDELCHSLTQ